MADKEKISGKSNISSKKAGIILVIIGLLLVVGIIGAIAVVSAPGNTTEAAIEQLKSGRPEELVYKPYEEPEFTDDENRTNNAFNVADFGEQGSNGWFYRYGDAEVPIESKLLEEFNGEKYYQLGLDGIELKKDFIHTAKDVAPILEWRAAETGSINIKLTYLKYVNQDSNPSWPDGVNVYIFKGSELLESHSVNIEVDKEVILETELKAVSVEENESIYFVIDPKKNNAYDGGLLYASIIDSEKDVVAVDKDLTRIDNNANNITDFGTQGTKGWYYMYGKEIETAQMVSDYSEDNGYINNTSPGLTLKNDFLHPASNDNVILAWESVKDGNVDLRLKYYKYEENDGNPEWPDGVTMRVYKNNELLNEQTVTAPEAGENVIAFQKDNISVTPSDKLYFVIDANENSSYDGGRFEIVVRDRDTITDENSITINNDEKRQNFASVMDDFGEQGNNGWFFQEGYEDEPFGCSNMINYIMDDKYIDDSYLEIKRDFVTTGENNKSAVIKWKVAQDGKIAIEADYTKLKNEDANPTWPDGTRVTLYHNNTVLVQQEFEADTEKEIAKELNVEELEVKRGDYITMVINGKKNNAYDGAKYHFSIKSLDKPVGADENSVVIPKDESRTNNASVANDFGEQGNNGWFYQYGYYTKPFLGVNVENFDGVEKYTTADGIEIKKDYISPSTKGKSANVKWKVARDGEINIYCTYTKLKNEDKNPSWPDGTVVTLLLNNSILAQEEFAPDTEKEVFKDLSQLKVKVKRGDFITLIVDGKVNTAYDGGLYTFGIEDADKSVLKQENNSGSNTADLSSDFGAQGNNGWYYLEGNSILECSILTEMNADKSGFTSSRSPGLELKKDYVHPGSSHASVYQWIVADTGKVNVSCGYMKYGQNDGNPDYPDGTTIKVYLNNKLLKEEKVTVKQGDGNNNSISLSFKNLQVQKADKITFMVFSDSNNAWDGGSLSASINPVLNVALETGRVNDTTLANDFAAQGVNGWLYGYGTTPTDFELCSAAAPNANEAYTQPGYDGLEMKKDYVQPASNKGAIYQWTVAEAGNVNISGSYTKYEQHDLNPDWPDGTTVKIFINDKNIWSHEFAVKTMGETSEIFNLKNKTVKAGDKITFIISAKDNNAWDGGRLTAQIKEASAVEDEIVYKPGKDNVTNLFNNFGNQGSDGWYYGYGNGGTDFTTADKNGEEYSSVLAGGLLVKKDGVHPSSVKGAIYRWVVAENGQIDIDGAYYKSKNENAEDNAPDGVLISVYKNGILITGMRYDVTVSKTEEIVQQLDKKALEVKSKDILDFVITCKENAGWDYGKLEVDIKATGEVPEAPVIDSSNDNSTDLFNSFGPQGSDGWYYGKCDWNGTNFELLSYNASENRYYDNGKPELKADFVEPGNGKNAAYKWIAPQGGQIKVTGKYIKYPNNEDALSTGVCMRIFHNGTEKKWIGDGINHGGITANVEVSFDETYTVSAGDAIMFAIDSEGNDARDGGKLEVTIEPVNAKATPTPEDNRTNNTYLAMDFGAQASNGWYYGKCDWNGANFELLPYNASENRYYDNGKPEIKADFVEPGNGKNAAYKWIAAEDELINVAVKYTKYPNSEDPLSTGVCIRIYHNGVEKKWIGDGINHGGITENVVVYSSENYWVRAGDEIVFAIDSEGNDAWDGGKLEVSIAPVIYTPMPIVVPPTPEPTPSPDANRNNNANLAADFGAQASNGWYYGKCDWNGLNFALLSYNAEENRYYDNGKPELKADFVEPGNGRNAAYRWIVAENGQIRVTGKYTKYPNSEDAASTGVCMRIFHNGTEKKWIGDGINHGGITGNVEVTFDETYTVTAGDVIMFAIDPEGNDAWDGGKLEVIITPVDITPVPTPEVTSVPTLEATPEPTPEVTPVPTPEATPVPTPEVTPEPTPEVTPEPTPEVTPEPTPEATRTNNASLASDFGAQGSNGWNYGKCDWNGANYELLTYNAEENRYYDNGKPELKADFVEPGNWKNAAYQWTVAEDGQISVTGKYTKYPNSDDAEATGVCMRIFINGTEVKWIGDGINHGGIIENVEVTFNETYTVSAGDVIIFAINPEGNDAWDGGKLEVTITPNN